jgi:type IV secretion system protein VirD4
MPKEFRTDEALKEAGAYAEMEAHFAYRRRGIIVAVAIALFTLPLVWPLTILFHPGVIDTTTGRSADWETRLAAANLYFSAIGQMLTLQLSPHDFFRPFFGDWIQGMISGLYPGQWIGPLAWAVTPVIIGLGLTAKNPYRKTPNIYGDARYANAKDIEEMSKRNLVGFDKSLFIVGKWREKGRKGEKMIRMGETLSILLLAPPGTGKSIGFIVPSTVELDRASLFIHDQKPELFDMTSGHRATVGPVFQIKWSAQDAPDGEWLNEEQVRLVNPGLLARDADGNPIRDDMGRYKTKPVFYPCWNPLSPKSMPGPGDRRDLYIERLVNVLCPDPKGGGDKFWTSKARAALVGLIQFLVAKVDYATHPQIKGGWDGIPAHWHGREASFPMLIDWLTEAQSQSDDGSDDPMRQMFKACVEEARRMDERFEQVLGTRVLNRAIAELVQLMNSPDKTRGSILQTADEALGPFKNAAVRQRTSSSDFAFYELRGMPVPEAKAREEEKVRKALEEGRIYKPRYAKEEFRPVTIYISVNLEDAKTFAALTGIFVDAANAYLVANGPNAIDDQGNQCGPYDFGFLLDEAPQLPKLDTVTNGPAVGRSKRVFYVIVGQDFGQFEEKYSKAEVETLKSTTAIKVVLTQNNENSAKQVAAMVGKTTIIKHSYSKDKGTPKKGVEGFVSDLLPKKDNVSESLEGVDFIRPSDVMSLPEGRHLVIVQNYANRPIYAWTPRFFETPSIAAKVYNLRSYTGPAPATPMPVHLMEAAAVRISQGRLAAQKQAELRQRAKDPRVVAVVSPEDLHGLTRSEFGERTAPGRAWSFAALDWPEDAAYLDIPEPDAILTTEDPAEAARFLQGGRTLAFDRPTFDRLNAWLQDGGQAPLPAELFVSLADRARDAGEEPGDSLYYLGHNGSSRQELPDDPSQVTPDLAFTWMVNIMSFVLGIEEQRRLFDFS